MLREQVTFVTVTKDITTDKLGVNLNLRVGDEMPLLLAVQSGDINTSRDEDRARNLSNRLKRSLDTIKNFTQNTYYHKNMRIRKGKNEWLDINFVE